MKDQLEEFLWRDWDNLQVNIFIMSVPRVGILPVTEEAKLCRMVFESWIRMHLGAFTVRPMTPMVMAFHQTLDPEFERLGLNKFDAHKVYLELYPVHLKFHHCNNHVPLARPGQSWRSQLSIRVSVWERHYIHETLHEEMKSADTGWLTRRVPVDTFNADYY